MKPGIGIYISRNCRNALLGAILTAAAILGGKWLLGLIFIPQPSTSSEVIQPIPKEPLHFDHQEIIDRHNKCLSDACKSGHLEGYPTLEEVNEAKEQLQ